MKLTKSLLGPMFAASLVASLTTSQTFADSDSSAMDSSTMTAVVENSGAVMIRVPVDADGHELSSAAEMRVTAAVDASTLAALPTAWNDGIDMTRAPILDSSTDSDSSTNHSGWNQWNNYNSGWGNTNYNRNSCYNNYRPVYYNYGNQYSYSNPRYYNTYQPFNYGNYSCHGYSYYYYPRHRR